MQSSDFVQGTQDSQGSVLQVLLALYVYIDTTYAETRWTHNLQLLSAMLVMVLRSRLLNW